MNDLTRRYRVGLDTFLQFKKMMYVYVQENLGDSNVGMFIKVFKQDLTSYFYLFIYILAYLSSYHEKTIVRKIRAR